MNLDVENIRNQFPILKQKINGKPLVYLDNAATTQKPLQVIDRIKQYYESENSNVHRGVHKLSQIATEKFENARKYIAGFINANCEKEIIFTKGTTDSINFLSIIFADLVSKNDEILVSAMEHHSNLVPWQQLCKRKGAKLRVIPVLENGDFDLISLQEMLSIKTKLLAVTHVSNVLGTINPVKEIVRLAHQQHVPVLIDGAQAIAHLPVDVLDIGCDFYTFSGHKAYGPMGIGVLYGKEEWLNKLPPYQYGGEMVDSVSFEEAVFNKLPYKYEAGTPNVSGAIGFEAALRFIESNNISTIQTYEDELLVFATNQIMGLEGVKILGTSANKTAVLSFNIDSIHPYDIGTLLDQMGVAVRTGYHCAQPLIDHFGLPGTLRASLAIYNTKEDIESFIKATDKAIQMLK
jgi:cysteine desulfurase/selenocysteine lyase